MSIPVVIAKKLLGVFLGILGIFKRMMCFLNIKRGRKNSGSLLPLHADAASSVPQSVPSNDEVELESWDNWGDGDNSGLAGFPTNSAMPNHLQQQASRRPNTMPVFLNNKPEQEPEPDIDYFTDMTPKIKKAAKILIKNKKEENGTSGGLSSRLAMTNDVHLAPIEATSENLDSWQDTENGWGEEAMEDLSWQAESAIRDKKLMDRERRLVEHQRRKQEKEMARNTGKSGQFSAVKLS